MRRIDRLARLAEAGVSIWLDDLSRERLISGNLAELIRDHHVSGVTTNPTIFENAISYGEAYDGRLHELAVDGADPDTAVRELTTTDVREAADLFRGVHHATDGTDGWVSIEVDPRLARDTGATVAEARRLWEAVHRPNVFVKIPATKEGLPAITAVLAEGISVNVTLIFSPDRYRAVVDAFFAGIEQAEANGHYLGRIASVASFFVSRMDTEVDRRLDAIGTDKARSLRGVAAIANARVAFGVFEELFATDRWHALAAAGARPQRPLWASTSVKNPRYPDTRYVDELVVAGAVSTMPEETLFAVADHAHITGDTVSGTAMQAREVFDRLAGVGINLSDVFRVLEDEGVGKFERSWRKLLDSVAVRLVMARE
ncbi:transaldolase [Planotetraspora thailandica]|uniref:Transaldolase n=1 Tax=Planotetraspora thailandica TaxID=487172 RepID=A0A8J3XWZ2_9ACTN|nr:transaldolase [Planotetraspora thailandica]GII55939.1 transaldolase [Planotetraspora thailandica]